LPQAAQVYQRAIALEPHDPVLRFNLGNVLYGLGRAGEAAASFREAVRIDREYAEAWNNLGNALAELGELDDATSALQQAVRIVPEYADVHFNLADVLRRAGQSGAAAKHQALYEKYSSANRLLAHRARLLRVFRDETQTAVDSR
jgi:superkiller protein 3